MKKIALLLILSLCFAFVLSSCGGEGGMEITESAAVSVQTGDPGHTESDQPRVIPEDVENPSQGLELAETYSKEFGDAYVVTGIGACEDVDIVIPSTVNGKPVVEIAVNAFWKNNNIKSVYCGNRVTTIGRFAFKECKKLKTVVIPDSVEYIGEEAFCQCNLTSVEMGDNVKEMERGVFQWNKYLKSIKLSRALINVPEDTFTICSALAAVELSPATESIAKQVFHGTAMKRISIPATVKSIGENTFPAGLQYIDVDENNPYYCSVDGVLFSKDMSTLIAYPQARGSYTVPEGVKIISKMAFIDLTYEVTLPGSLRTIEKWAFSGHYGNSYTVNIKKGVSYIDDFAFDCVTGNVIINFEGTKEEWTAVRKAENWYTSYSGIGDQVVTVNCSDGVLTFDYAYIY